MRVRRLIAATVLSGATLVAPVTVAQAQDSPASVLPSVVERPTQVKGVQLPRTGGDLDAEVWAGVALTAAGAALAVAARERRRRYAAQA